MKYNCYSCNYETDSENRYNRHIKSKKHAQINITPIDKKDKKVNKVVHKKKPVVNKHKAFMAEMNEMGKQIKYLQGLVEQAGQIALMNSKNAGKSLDALIYLAQNRQNLPALEY